MAIIDFNPLIQRSFSDDGGYTFKGHSARALGKEGEYKKRQIWRREGVSNESRIYRFIHDSPTEFAVMGLRADVE
jgi:hypothetical protein